MGGRALGAVEAPFQSVGGMPGWGVGSGDQSRAWGLGQRISGGMGLGNGITFNIHKENIQ